ncbi:hypothetical protein [Flavobacterium okayamense]|nr:hypothetical protein [Flavobacterium okayamense]
MRKITLILAFIGMISLTSCTVEETYVVDNGYDNDTISEVWEYTNVDLHSGNGYSVFLDFPHTTYTSDMILVYRLADYGSAGDVWKLLPETYYFSDGTVDFGYSNDATIYDAQVSMFGYDLPGLNDAFKFDQIFRVVVIPGYYGNKMATAIDFSDYNAVTTYYNIKEKDIVKISQ